MSESIKRAERGKRVGGRNRTKSRVVEKRIEAADKRGQFVPRKGANRLVQGQDGLSYWAEAAWDWTGEGMPSQADLQRFLGDKGFIVEAGKKPRPVKHAEGSRPKARKVA